MRLLSTITIILTQTCPLLLAAPPPIPIQPNPIPSSLTLPSPPIRPPLNETEAVCIPQNSARFPNWAGEIKAEDCRIAWDHLTLALTPTGGMVPEWTFWTGTRPSEGRYLMRTPLEWIHGLSSLHSAHPTPSKDMHFNSIM